ncbi:hypothetical protein [Endozoicomonas sp. GU-1]|uniref:hypothetical protein n=1 Tax=Endozoicomonas sp. GU-1 TaxID=3009078 RepID=UPI0022B471C3|nr:hypothetical protein [Endozoicomonas sp. GU-1]WBA83483.1 hypothetical protein O2T12_10325 [Endozoicomonas sp. GU-1]WBA86417.1 hypothetical protein O3276_25015 [Endozoicomonas sp. GU-1]
MHRTSAANARSGNYYRQPDNQAASSRPGRYRHDMVNLPVPLKNTRQLLKDR